MTYEQLQKENEQLTTTEIKGKQYVEVNQRIKAFRSLFPNGAIRTNIESLDGGVCVIKATIYDEEGKALADGMAYEKEGSTFINKTSYIENCETSAVGRALGMCGIGIDTSVASAEELVNAIENQKITKENKSVNEKNIYVPEDLKENVLNLMAFLGVDEKTIIAMMSKKHNKDFKKLDDLDFMQYKLVESTLQKDYDKSVSK